MVPDIQHPRYIHTTSTQHEATSTQHEATSTQHEAKSTQHEATSAQHATYMQHATWQQIFAVYRYDANGLSVSFAIVAIAAASVAGTGSAVPVNIYIVWVHVACVLHVACMFLLHVCCTYAVSPSLPSLPPVS